MVGLRGVSTGRISTSLDPCLSRALPLLLRLDCVGPVLFLVDCARAGWDGALTGSSSDESSWSWPVAVAVAERGRPHEDEAIGGGAVSSSRMRGLGGEGTQSAR